MTGMVEILFWCLLTLALGNVVITGILGLVWCNVATCWQLMLLVMLVLITLLWQLSLVL